MNSDLLGIDKTYAKAYDTVMTTISATQARTKLYDLLDEVSQTGERVGITKKGETKAVLVSQEELASLEATLDVMSDTKLVRGIKKGMEDIKAGRLVEWKDVKKKFGM
ncbi:MAG: Prevent-host-death protein [Microgenomates group bacterium GW2011_GWA2_39_19]|nr:MAG: Prevent-host-death protein [Microgenomates group bacterium GW2011_GWA2_39_19]HBL52431.1 hypothetical protein [Candidatus Blackburnbacteria bacterium]